MPESDFPRTRTVGALTSDTLIFKIKPLACRKLRFCHSCSVEAQQDRLSLQLMALLPIQFDHLTLRQATEESQSHGERSALGQFICFKV